MTRLALPFDCKRTSSMRRSSQMRLRFSGARSFACAVFRQPGAGRPTASTGSFEMATIARSVTPSTSVRALCEVWQGQRPLAQWPTAHWSSLLQLRSAGWPRESTSRQTGFPRSARASCRPCRLGSLWSMREKKTGITSRGWQAESAGTTGTGASMPSPPQRMLASGFLPCRMFLQSCVEQPAEAMRPKRAPRLSAAATGGRWGRMLTGTLPDRPRRPESDR